MCSESGTDHQLLLSGALNAKQLDLTPELSAQRSSRTEILVKRTYEAAE